MVVSTPNRDGALTQCLDDLLAQHYGPLEIFGGGPVGRVLARFGTDRYQVDWASLASGCLLSAGLFAASMRWGEPALGEAPERFTSQKAISLAIAIMGCYLVGKYLSEGGSTRWWHAAPPSLLFMNHP